MAKCPENVKNGHFYKRSYEGEFDHVNSIRIFMINECECECECECEYECECPEFAKIMILRPGTGQAMQK